MPRKRGGGGGLCGCFGGGDEPPSITYEVDNGMLLHPMEVAEPMPPLEELNVKFAELVVSILIENIWMSLYPFFFFFFFLKSYSMEW